jgi:hypothetical protein
VDRLRVLGGRQKKRALMLFGAEYLRSDHHRPVRLYLRAIAAMSPVATPRGAASAAIAA